MNPLRKFLLLPLADRQVLLQAAILLWFVRLGLWLLPFSALHRLLVRLAQAHVLRRSASTRDRIVWAVEAASRYVPGTARCLPRALAAQVLLECSGFPANLHIGVARGEEGRLQAHAWVESQGEIAMGDSELERYTRLWKLKGKRP